MAKKIVDENGNTYVQKKPFYKRWWFWLLVLIVVGGIGGNMNGDSSSSTGSTAISKKPNVPTSYITALNSAKTYANTMHMSKQAIYDQLTSDAGNKYKPEAAQYAVDHVKANWNENALKKAKEYQKDMNMSPDAIRDQLTSSYGEKFTQEQADYAVSHLE